MDQSKTDRHSASRSETGLQRPEINSEISDQSRRNLEGNYILIRVGKHAAEALIDTGTMCFVIGEPFFARQLKLKIQPLLQPCDKMVSANGSRMEIHVVGTVDMNLYLRGLTYCRTHCSGGKS